MNVKPGAGTDVKPGAGTDVRPGAPDTRRSGGTIQEQSFQRQPLDELTPRRQPLDEPTARQPLDQLALRAQVLASSSLWSALDVLASTGSTNEDLATAGRAGAPGGRVLAAEEQTRGRGRLGRSWHSVPGAALTFSVLLRPAGIPLARLGWLPLLAGVAVAAAVRGQTAVDASLKWPNDVLSGNAKLAGILAEQAGGAVIIGFGINVSATRQELPSGQATSLWLRGAVRTDRQALLAAVLREFEHWYLRWVGGPRPGDAEAIGLRAEYLRHCATVGQEVRVELPGGGVLAGRARDVDGRGQLVVATAQGLVPVSAGDVIHARISPGYMPP